MLPSPIAMTPDEENPNDSSRVSEIESGSLLQDCCDEPGKVFKCFFYLHRHFYIICNDANDKY